MNQPTYVNHEARTFDDDTRFAWFQIREGGLWHAEQYGEGGAVVWSDSSRSQGGIVRAIEQRREELRGRQPGEK